MTTLANKPATIFCVIYTLLVFPFMGCRASIHEEKEINILSTAIINHPTVTLLNGVDTNLVFTKLDEIYSYQNTTFKKIYKECQQIRKDQPNGYFTADSTYSYQQELFLVLLYKNLLRLDKGEKEFFSLNSLFELSTMISYNKKKALFMQFSDKLRHSDTGKKTWETLNRSTSHEGMSSSHFPSLSLRDKEGNPFLLNDLLLPNHKNLIVLGATWCAPCAYQDKKIEQYIADKKIDTARLRIIYISIDENVTKWQESLQTKIATQQHYNHAEGLKGNFFPVLGVRGVPHYILLSEQHTIIREGLNIDPLLPYIQKQ